MAGEKLTPAQLSRKRTELVRELNRVEQQLNELRKQDRHVMRSEEVEWGTHGQGSVMLKKSQFNRKEAKIIGAELGFNCHNFQMGCIEIAPGSEEGAYHMHGEAIKYYLHGKGIEIIGDKKYEVKAGDAVFIPASTWHGTQNPGPEPIRFLAITHSGTGVPLAIWPSIRTKDDE